MRCGVAWHRPAGAHPTHPPLPAPTPGSTRPSGCSSSCASSSQPPSCADEINLPPRLPPARSPRTCVQPHLNSTFSLQHPIGISTLPYPRNSRYLIEGNSNEDDWGPVHFSLLVRLGRGLNRALSNFTCVGSFNPVTPAGQTYGVAFSFAMLLIQSAYTANLAGAMRARASLRARARRLCALPCFPVAPRGAGFLRKEIYYYIRRPSVGAAKRRVTLAFVSPFPPRSVLHALAAADAAHHLRRQLRPGTHPPTHHPPTHAHEQPHFHPRTTCNAQPPNFTTALQVGQALCVPTDSNVIAIVQNNFPGTTLVTVAGCACAPCWRARGRLLGAVQSLRLRYSPLAFRCRNVCSRLRASFGFFGQERTDPTEQADLNPSSAKPTAKLARSHRYQTSRHTVVLSLPPPAARRTPSLTP